MAVDNSKWLLFFFFLLGYRVSGVKVFPNEAASCSYWGCRQFFLKRKFLILVFLKRLFWHLPFYSAPTCHLRSILV